MSEFIGFFVFLGVVFFGIGYGVNNWEEYKCEQYSNQTGLTANWVFFDECYITLPNKEVVTKDQYSAMLIARQGLKGE